MTQRDAFLYTYLDMVRKTVDKAAWLDFNDNIHFEEWDEKHRCHVPVVVTPHQAATYVESMMGG
jgi:hypothetical protein